MSSVIGHYWVRRRQRRGWHIWRQLASPMLGALVCTYVWASLTGKAKLVGILWMALGLTYLAFISQGFRLPPRRWEL